MLLRDPSEKAHNRNAIRDVMCHDAPSSNNRPTSYFAIGNDRSPDPYKTTLISLVAFTPAAKMHPKPILTEVESPMITEGWIKVANCDFKSILRMMDSLTEGFPIATTSQIS